MLFHLDLMILPWLFDEGLLCQKYTDQGTQIGIYKIPPIKRHLLPIAMSLWHKGTYNIVLYSVLKSAFSYNSPSPCLLGHSRMFSVYSTVYTVQCVQYSVYSTVCTVQCVQGLSWSPWSLSQKASHHSHCLHCPVLRYFLWDRDSLGQNYVCNKNKCSC